MMGDPKPSNTDKLGCMPRTDIPEAQTLRRCYQKPVKGSDPNNCSKKMFSNPDSSGLTRTFGISFNSTTAFYHCHRNHHFVKGDLVRHCQNGRWSGSEPVCEVDGNMHRLVLATWISVFVIFCFFALLLINFCQRYARERQHSKDMMQKHVFESVRQLKISRGMRPPRLSSYRSMQQEEVQQALRLQAHETFDYEILSQMEVLARLKGIQKERIFNTKFQTHPKKELQDLLLTVRNKFIDGDSDGSSVDPNPVTFCLLCYLEQDHHCVDELNSPVESRISYMQSDLYPVFVKAKNDDLLFG